MANETVPETPALRHVRRARDLRRISLAALVLLVAVGLTGLLGHRSTTATQSAGPYRLSVEHPARTRAGLPAELRFVARRDGGFGESVTLGVSAEYLELFPDQELSPQPSSSTSDGPWLYLEFDAPPGDTLTVRYHSRVATGAYRGRDGVVAVFEDGDAAVSVGVETGVVP